MGRDGGYTLDVVLPCFNEAQTLADTIPVAREFFETQLAGGDLGLSAFRLILVDDGSTDDTWAAIQFLAAKDARIIGVKLSRNFGHQSALMAGLSQVDADACVSIDADLQQDIGAVRDMLLAYEKGADLALGVREGRTADTLFKAGTASLFYGLLRLLGARIIPDHADFRLMSRRALAALMAHEEVNLFLRGLVPSLGFNVVLVPYKHHRRQAGESKYTLRKMLRLAVDGVTSFTMRPLRLVSMLGFGVCALSLLAVIYVLVIRVVFPGQGVAAWASPLLPIMVLGGLQLLSIGILGEYVGKIYMEVKRRPRFLIEDVTRVEKE